MSFTFRPYEEKDQSKINEIEAASFKDPWPSSFFNYMHDKAPDLFLVAREDEEIVGYVVGEIREIMFSGLSHKSSMGHILNIAVNSRCRNRGMGTRLMQEIEKKYRMRGVARVTLEVRESNTTARSFYQGLGFSEIGRVRAYYPDEDAVIMSKLLEND